MVLFLFEVGYAHLEITENKIKKEYLQNLLDSVKSFFESLHGCCIGHANPSGRTECKARHEAE